eukprot:4331980-Alexandrium_andersonii.AAC.1
MRGPDVTPTEGSRAVTEAKQLRGRPSARPSSEGRATAHGRASGAVGHSSAGGRAGPKKGDAP